MISAYEWGLKHGSCEGALAMRRALGPDKSQADWWRACKRGDWLIWQLKQLPRLDNSTNRGLLRAINVIADRAVRNYKGGIGWRILRWFGWEGRDCYVSAHIVEPLMLSAETAALVTAPIGRLQLAGEITHASTLLVDNQEQELFQQAIDIRTEIPEWLWD